MAQHDYVIANGTGAAVRSDLNNALAAIVSQNSGATEPATMYAYQWWADTSTGLLKLRNGANNAWITLRELDGTLTIEAGTVSAPGLAFASDLNTGIYSPGADQLGITTGGTVRLTTSTTGITSALPINVPLGTVSAPTVTFTGDLNTGIYSPGADQVAISTNGVERVDWGTSEVVFNDGGTNYDFRVEGDTNANLLFVDASADAVGIGTSAPATILDVQAGAGSNDGISVRRNTSASTGHPFRALDQVGGEKFYVDFGGGAYFASNVGIGTTSPARLLHVASSAADGAIVIDGGSSNAAFLDFRIAGTNKHYIGSANLLGSGTNSDMTVWNSANGYLNFGTNGTERFRCDSSGRLLVGTSSTSSVTSLLLSGNSFSSTSYGALRFARGTTAPANDDTLGYIAFGDSGHTDAATIRSFRNGGTWTSGTSQPTGLAFSVTRDGASSPTEAVRISSTGAVRNESDQNVEQFVVDNTNGSLAAGLVIADSSRAANSAYYFFVGASGNRTDNEFILRGDGNGLCDGAWTGGGADYAEYFEWSDSNPDAEDRRGISVVLDGDKIREAQPGEDPIGVISGNPSVVGDAAWNKWSGKYLRDEFGTYIQEDYEVTDDDGNTIIQQRRKLNPAYDPNVEYTSREERPEWDCVGLMGKLRIRKGQVTGSRWVKMRDISDSVEEWLVR